MENNISFTFTHRRTEVETNKPEDEAFDTFLKAVERAFREYAQTLSMQQELGKIPDILKSSSWKEFKNSAEFQEVVEKINSFDNRLVRALVNLALAEAGITLRLETEKIPWYKKKLVIVF